ncbi:HNH endonuclease [Rhodococcus sp. 15-725-2-2b]|uniref:HNH endonuclease n=1 Tax=unclassified Rhodococcus (in: high G+C Gram-positive bacteria) TaxID=192944 RepID=UPI000B9B4776|nr:MULTISPECIES: HNH endonuclease [unclassified Rhodococcus (in: high G+C Gram-positive bacteria)]OZC62010.1 HNH endonuclease [Rhodococcus sp. 06-470-2]OZC64492.1 HNH endonuclease [Rhodococcus sp. 06-469-3-2]OZD51125.1 HNH endonuclease [Rhodococcus sp. 06-1477-1A]OZE58140.1 HNH endonuclease [Rhodococcus sp. 05-2221-1B]OZE71564.1 HNH endonuclease [Rhodococcus sp. 15-725-2-2b]
MAISERTRKMLWTRAHNRCAFPGCWQMLTVDIDNVVSGSSDVVVVGMEAHIRARSVGGPRYDASYADVNGYDNLVLLCPTHHTLIDANHGAGYAVNELVKMKVSHEKNQERRDRLQSVLRSYLGDRYTAENTVQFQQVDLHGPSVDSMFVDVPVGCRRDNSAVATLFGHIRKTAPGDTTDLESASGFVVAGATQALLHPQWQGSAVLVGGPGQGKSTVLQYVCQFHRARRLGKKDAYTATQAELDQVTAVNRFPIRVDLRKYAQWAIDTPSRAAGRKGKPSRTPDGDTWSSLEEYLLKEIGSHIGAQRFKPDDLTDLIATEPVLLALDGLDEVAKVSDRSRVVDEIVQCRGRLAPDAADLMILVATRPGSSLQPLTSSGAFPTLHLQRLTPGLRLQYLQRWSEVSRLPSDAAARLEATFLDSQHVPHVNELASYPMQLAILLHLLYRRQLLPQQRTELYAEYLKTFLDREQTEDKEPLLAEQRRVVEDTHAYLGWYLQSRAETGRSAGRITREELRHLLREYLAGQPEEQKLADELYSAITDRVLCLVERDDAFEFEVQSLREYFAALHIADNLTPKGQGNSRDDGLNALLERPYWANVCRFFIGMLTRGEIRALHGNFCAVDNRVAPHPLVRAMAVMVLNDRIFDGLTTTEIRGVVDFVLEGPGVIFSQDGVLDAAGTPLRLGDRAGRSQAVAHLKERLANSQITSEMRDAASLSLFAHAVPDDQLSSWWWGEFEPTTAWLQTAARLRALHNLDSVQTHQLISALTDYEDPGNWRVQLLNDGEYDDADTDILDAARNDLNNGAAEGIRHQWIPDGPNTSLTDLIHSATTVRTHLPDTASTSDWQSSLEAHSRTWGDGWVLRRAVASAPNNIDLMDIASNARTQALTDAARAEASYRHHKDDPTWWQDEFLSITTPIEQMLRLIAAFGHTRTSTFVELGPTIDRLVHTLLPKHFRTVEQALRRDHEFHSIRGLNIADALRLQQLTLSGRTLWLAWIVGSDLTRERVTTRLSPELRDVFLAGTADGRPAVEAAGTPRKIKLDTFIGARRELPSGEWAGRARLATMSTTISKAVLRDPDQWPVDVVQLALDKMSMYAAERALPLSSLADNSNWFS